MDIEGVIEGVVGAEEEVVGINSLLQKLSMIRYPTCFHRSQIAVLQLSLLEVQCALPFDVMLMQCVTDVEHYVATSRYLVFNMCSRPLGSISDHALEKRPT